MTIEEKLNSIITTKEAIKTSIRNKGVEIEDTDPFVTYSTKIDEITGQAVIETENIEIIPTKEEQVINRSDDKYIESVKVNAIPDEYIIPTGNLNINLNGNYNVNDKASVEVNVQPSLQEKKVYVKPDDNNYIMPDEEYYGLAYVNVIGAVDTENVEATPTKETQTINRSEKKYIESVTINPIPNEYIIPSGELEITENGQYNVVDKASVNVEITSGGSADLSEYFNETITSSNSSSSGFANAIKKLPAFINSGTSCAYMFTKYLGEYIDLSNFDTSNVTDFSCMFQYASNLLELDVSNFDTSKATTMASMFHLRSASGISAKIKKIVFGDKFVTTSVKNMSNMFTGCAELTSIDLSNFTTDLVTNMSSMFSGCNNLTSINVSNFNTSLVTNMSSMFASCNALEGIDVSNFVTNLVTNMGSMFSYCHNLTSIDLSNFSTEKVTNMSSMFTQCKKLMYLDIRNFDFTKVTSSSSMFGSSASNGVPNDCLIIVKDETAKTWITSKFSRLTNVKTVAEYEAG